MTHVESVAVTAQSFGRDSAMFEGLLGFVAQLSVVLWSLVILTVVIRFVGIRFYRRAAGRTALVETVAPSAAAPAAIVPTPAMPIATAGIDLVQPDAGKLTVTASVKVPHREPRNQRAEPRSAAHVPALSADSTEARAWTSHS